MGYRGTAHHLIRLPGWIGGLHGASCTRYELLFLATGSVVLGPGRIGAGVRGAIDSRSPKPCGGMIGASPGQRGGAGIQ